MDWRQATTDGAVRSTELLEANYEPRPVRDYDRRQASRDLIEPVVADRARPLSLLTFADFAALERWAQDWDRLAVRASQSFAYLRAGWDCREADAQRLHLLTVWRGPELVGAWPLYQARRAGISVARHIGSGSLEEYADPLLLDGAGSAEVVAALFDEALCIADVLEIYNVAAGGPLDGLIRDRGTVDGVQSIRSPVTEFSQSANWDDWFRGKSKSFRDGLKNDRNRLKRLGEVAFVLADQQSGPALIDWLLDHKRRWLDAHLIGRSWLRRQRTAEFYKRAVGRGEGVEVFALTLDGRPVVAGICLLGAGLLEFFVTAFDVEFHRYSPGNLLVEDMGRFCVERGLDLDFRLTTTAYKQRWTDRFDDFHTYVIPTTRRGRLELRRRRVANTLGRGGRAMRKIRRMLAFRRRR